MTKSELIDRIKQINHTARREFLLQFTEDELHDYLRQLESIRQPAAVPAAAQMTAG